MKIAVASAGHTGFEAETDRNEALADLAQWLETQPATDRFDRAAEELAERGLTR